MDENINKSAQPHRPLKSLKDETSRMIIFSMSQRTAQPLGSGI